MTRRLSLSLVRSALLGALLFTVGCPHRSPLWSPDGKRLLVLGGPAGEDVEKAASRLWLVDVGEAAAQAVPPPKAGLRFLGAAWVDAERALVLTTRWEEDAPVEGSGAAWIRSFERGAWTRLEAPVPSEERTPKRPPVIFRDGARTLAAYPSGPEAVAVVELPSGRTVTKLEPAELVGPGPKGGILLERPDPEGGLGNELAAYSPKLELIWKKSFSELRAAIAERTKKKPIEVIFNAAQLSEVPELPQGDAGSVAVLLVFTDVGWREGIPGYYAVLDGRTGSVRAAASATALPGRPGLAAGLAWCVTAPVPKEKVPPALRGFDPATGAERARKLRPDLSKEAVHGYAVSPDRKRLVVALNRPEPVLEIYTLPELERLAKIRLP